MSAARVRSDAALANTPEADGRGPGVRAAPVPWAWPLLLAGAVWLGLFYGLGAVPLFDVDEGAFGEATREMLASGDYVSTWLNGQPRFDKPILTYWLQAASVRLLGLDEFALRLPSAFAATAWIAAIYAFARRAIDRDTARAAAFIAATSAGVIVIGRGAIADALLNLFLALAMFDVYRELVDPRPRWRRRAFLWIGLGVLTKGPVALLIPGAAGAIAFLLQGRMAGWWRAARDPVGWAILLGVAAPWYMLEYARRGDAFLAGFFMRHNVERFLAPLQGHAGGVFYYLPALALLALPYTSLLLATLPGLRRLRASPLDTLLWCWFLFVFAFFTLAGTKLPHYLLYGATPLFILMARRRGALRNRVLALLPALSLAVAVAALPFVLDHVASGARNAYVREALSGDGVFDEAWAAQALAVVAAILLLALWPDRRRAGPWPRLVAAALICAYALVGLVLPAVAELQQGPVKRAALLARQAGWPVRSWRINAPSFSVYRAAITPAAGAPRAGDVILTRSDALDSLPPLRVLFREGGVLLVRIDG
ncbi:ArnT family glycosyltransferase [Massilia putida]|uniref:ArnT family glycosyltransferase n=1 Tax=Massilia putida TaxID=1141883 RepID=UPI0009F95078|nr:glycosyltransferase family 39 protein [Massilia putida]